MRTVKSAPWDGLPSTRSLVEHSALRRLGLDAEIVTALVRQALAKLREQPPASRTAAVDAVVAAVTRAADRLRVPSRRYVNATGIIIHTHWGNAPLADAAEDQLRDAAGASPTGPPEIGERTRACASLLTALTGAEDATVTTQNAASCLLVGAALARGREIICAARDLVEISQGARLRDILEAGGARVVPVGAANCVYEDDYHRAIGPDTAAIVRIYSANSLTTGYTAHVATASLAKLAGGAGVPLVVNLGSGCLADLRQRGLPYAPMIGDEIRSGADLVLASGDKLVGGPQAGIVCGRGALIAQLAAHPVARCCRPGKLTLAALEATLASYATGRAWEDVPVLRLLGAPADALCNRARTLVNVLESTVGADRVVLSVCADVTECGGAALPGVGLSTWTVRLAPSLLTCDVLHAALLRRGVVTRRRDGAVVVDLRSVLPEHDRAIAAALASALHDDQGAADGTGPAERAG